MPIRLIVSFNVQPGKADEFIQRRLERLAEVRQEPGCLQYELLRSTEHPDVVVLLELWSDAETLAAHSALNQSRPPLTRDLEVSRSTQERYEHAPSGPRPM